MLPDKDREIQRLSRLRRRFRGGMGGGTPGKERTRSQAQAARVLGAVLRQVRRRPCRREGSVVNE